MKTELPEELIPHLGSAMAMDVHWVDLKLKNRKTIRKVIVRGGRYIVGVEDGTDTPKEIELKKEDIMGLRRHGLILFGNFKTLEAEPDAVGNG